MSDTDFQQTSEARTTPSGLPQSAASPHAYREGPRPLGGLYEAMRVTLLMYIGVEVIYAAIAGGYGLGIIGDPEDFISQSYQSGLSDVLDVVQFLLSLVPFFFACRFTYRAMRNLHTVGATKAKVSPTMSVVWYFIPIANLFMPAVAMNQIYEGSHDVTEVPRSGNGIIWLWWCLYVFVGAPIVIAVFNYFTAPLLAAIMFGLSAAMSSGAALALITIGKRVTICHERLQHGGIADIFS